MHSTKVIQKKSLVSRKAAPASKGNSVHSRVDLSKPAPDRLLTASRLAGPFPVCGRAN